MGCDIHWFIEARDDDGHWHAVEMPRAYLEQYDNGWWCQYYDENQFPEEPDYMEYRKLCWKVDRNYALFDALTGTRCYAYERDYPEPHAHDIIGQIRVDEGYQVGSRSWGTHVGWPGDVSDRLLKQFEDMDHTPCWATLDELQDEHIAYAASYYGQAEGNGRDWLLLIKMMGELNSDPKKVRACWYYDS